MKLFYQSAALCLALAMLPSCSQDAPWGANGGKGKLHVNLETVSDVKAAVPAVRAITTDVVTPPDSLFGVTMVKEGGGFEQTWSSIADFEKVTSFPVGNYTISAFFGDDSSQGTVADEDDGYEYSQYYGETQVTIRENETTEVQLSVGLTNAIVVVEYTEAFKKYFKSYSTTLQPTGCEPLKIGENEAMNYVQPGELKITISAVQQNGQDVTLNAGKFNVEANNMYKLRYNIYNGEIGDAVLEISFDDSLETEPIYINLSSELDKSRAPIVSTIGFEPGADLVTLSGTPYTGEVKYAVVADGGISQAILTITPDNKDGYNPSYLINGEIDFCSISPEQKKAMEDDGIKAIGFQSGERKMAELDLSGLFRKLPEDGYKFSFQVTDELNQCNEPITSTLSCIPAEMSAMGFKKANYGDGEASLRVVYNGPDPIKPGNNPFSFTVNGKQCDIKSVSLESETSRADFPFEKYIYTISLPYIEEDSFNVDVLFNGVKVLEEPVVIDFTFPNYDDSMEYDAMANQLRFRLNISEKEKKNLIEKRMRVFVDGEEKPSSYDKNIGAYVVEGLEPGKKYEVSTSLQKATTPTEFSSSTNLTMESAAAVPNGDFEDLVEKINTTINQGGKWTNEKLNNAKRYQTTLSIQIKEAKGWVTSNSQTCNLNSANKNSWYIIPSVYNTTLSWVSHQPEAKVMGIGQSAYDSTADIYKNLTAKSGSNAMIIRNVAWDISGAEIAENRQTGNLDLSNYYCSNKPDEIANRTAGIMYLGSGNTEGVSFTGRPRALKGFYKYVNDPQDPDEKGKITVVLLNGDNEIGQGDIELNAVNDYTEFYIPLVDKYNFNQSVTKLKISISSSNKTSDIKTTNYCNKDECCSRGATLTVDNLTFEY